ncbi:TonB-dependent siderophore receptor [Pseudomonas nitroreducens]|uniref:TonB-dependent siderophore receptor n=1 Tax=Pseudomonas nitroreducens TaxID=46680 RepID=UPI0038196D2E
MSSSRHVQPSSLSLAVRTALFSLAVAVAAPAVMAASAPGEVRSYSIAPGPLGRALASFAAETGVRLSFEPTLTDGLQSPGLSGNYSTQGALERLLQGSGLELEQRGDGTFTLIRSPTPDALQMQPSLITGQAAGPEDLPAEYAGGQVARGGRLGLLGNTDLMDAPFSITSYTEKTIQDQQARSVADVLSNEPSAQIGSARTNLNEDFSLRGFPVVSADVALNGMYGLAPFFRVPVEMAERVEVVKGPSTMLNGMPPSGNVGGAVNLVTKRAGDEPLNRVTVDYLSDSVFGTHLDIGRRFGEGKEFGVRFNGVYRNGDTTVDKQELEDSLGSLGLDYTGERLRLSADYIHQREDITNVVRQFTAGPGVTKIPHAPDNDLNYPGYGDSEMTDRTLVVRGEYDIADWLTGYAGYGDRRSEMDALAGNPVLTGNDGDFVSSPAWQVYDVGSHSAEAGLRSTFNTGPVEHKLTFGATRVVQNSDIFFLYTAFPSRASNLYNPIYSGTPSTDDYPKNVQKYTAATLTSYALADTLSVLDGRVELTVGARKQRVESQNYEMNVGTPAGAGYDEEETTPMAGVVVKPWENISLYANYIEGLSPGETAPIGTANAGEMLSPYVSKQKEVGIKGEWDGFGATLAAFEIKRPSSVNDNGRFTRGGEQRNRGLELSLFGEVAEGARLLGGASYTQAKLTKTQDGQYDGNNGIGVPRQQLNLGGEYDIAQVPGLTVTARTIYTSEQYVDQANSLSIPDWWRLDLGARYRFETLGKPVVLRANLDNALDKDYWGTSTAGYLYLGEGRTLQLSASVDF